MRGTKRGIDAAVLSVAAGIAMAFLVEGTSWPWRGSSSPTDLDAAALVELATFVGGDGVVVHGDAPVYTWGDPAEMKEVGSAAKPVYAHFLGVALETGLLESLDQPVAAVERGHASRHSTARSQERPITWRHLVQQTSGYGLVEAPGEAFAYNDYQVALFFDALVTEVFGSTHEEMDDDILRPWLEEPLECEDEPTLRAYEAFPGRLGISLRDFARFGMLYRDEGRWNGNDVVFRNFVRQAIGSPLPRSFPETSGKRTQMLPAQRTLGGVKHHAYPHHGSTSFFWWTNPDRRKWPDAPEDTFAALGWSGRVALVVVPSLDLVASWYGEFPELEPGVDIVNEALRRLVAAAPPARAPGIGDHEATKRKGRGSEPFSR